MDAQQAKAVVSRFNDCINARDSAGLAQMMTDDHVFIDAANNSVSGKRACVHAWQAFFAAFPDYRNDLAHLIVRPGLVVVVGHSSCSDPRLDGPALWTAKVRETGVSEWRVLADTVENRTALGVANEQSGT
jgi:ketosteroid isomerase-like protein